MPDSTGPSALDMQLMQPITLEELNLRPDPEIENVKLLRAPDENIYYVLTIFGLTRLLELRKVAEDEWIAYYFNMDDIPVVEAAAKRIAHRLFEYEPDYLLTAVEKGIPITYATARFLDHPTYIPFFKEEKPFMRGDFLVVPYYPITAGRQERKLYLGGDYARKIQSKRVAIVDDFSSTGETRRAMKELAEKAGAQVVAQATIFAEGPYSHEGLIYLFTIPVFRPVR